MFQRRRNDSRWLWSSRFRTSRRGSSEESDAGFGEGDSGVVGDSARAETSVGASSVGALWSVKASKGTRSRGDEAVPRLSQCS